MDITVEYVRKVLEDERSRKSQPTPDSPVYKAKTRIAIEQFDGGKSLLDDINGYLSNTDWQDQSVGQSYQNKINAAKKDIQTYKNFATKNYDEEIAKQYNDYFDSVLKQYGDWEKAVNEKGKEYQKYLDDNVGDEKLAKQAYENAATAAANYNRISHISEEQLVSKANTLQAQKDSLEEQLRNVQLSRSDGSRNTYELAIEKKIKETKLKSQIEEVEKQLESAQADVDLKKQYAETANQQQRLALVSLDELKAQKDSLEEQLRNVQLSRSDGSRNTYELAIEKKIKETKLKAELEQLEKDITFKKAAYSETIKAEMTTDTQAAALIEKGKVMVESGEAKVPKTNVLTGNAGIEFLSQNDQNAYYYILGRDGEEQAKEYAKAMQDTANRRYGIAVSNKIENNWFLKVGSGATAGGYSFLGGLGQAFSEEAQPYSMYEYTGQYAREDLGGAGGFVYDVLHTVANQSIPAAVTVITSLATANPAIGTAAGAALMGTSAYGNSYRQALSEGYTSGEATQYAAMIGISETTLGALLGNLNPVKGITAQALSDVAFSGTAKAAAQLGKSIAGEFAEEYLQEVLEPVFRNIAYGENNKVELFTADAFYSGVLGGVTAALFGVGDFAGVATEAKRQRAFGKAVKSMDNGIAWLKSMPMSEQVQQHAEKLTADSSDLDVGAVGIAVQKGIYKDAVYQVKDALERANADGSYAQAIVDTGLGIPNAELAQAVKENKSLESVVSEFAQGELGGAQIAQMQKLGAAIVSTRESQSEGNYATKLINRIMNRANDGAQQTEQAIRTDEQGTDLPDGMRMEYQRNAAHSIGFDVEAEQALRRMSAEYDEQTQQALIDNYDYNQSPSEYAAAFDVVYNAAMQEGVALNDLYNLPGTTDLNDSQILAAMRAGRRARETAAQANVEQTAQNRSDTGGGTVDKTYNKYYYKKAIRITKQEHARVRAALAEKYARRYSEGRPLPELDYVHLGEQGKLNTAYIYVVRNYDFGSFEVVGKLSTDSKHSENIRRDIDELKKRTGMETDETKDAGRIYNSDMRNDIENGRDDVSGTAGLDRGASESERAGSAGDVAGDLGSAGRRGRDGERATTAERGIETDRDVQEDRYANEDRAWRAEYENEQQAQQKSLVKSIQNLFGRKDSNTGISEITRTIEKLFDVPVSTGHIAQRNALGIFKKKAEAIRTKVANALPVIAHELGHALDKTYKFTEKTEINEAAGVLARERPDWIDRYPVSQRPGEAVAEFFRNYLTDKQSTKQRYPAFYEMVRSTLSKKDLANLDTVADMVNRYMVRDQSERLKSAIVSVNQANKLNRKNQEYNELLERFVIDWTDNLFAIKNKIGQEAYDLAMNSRKINVKIANTLTGAYMSDMDGAPVQVGTQNGKPVYMPGLSTILKPVNDTVEMIEDFNRYLICKHAPEVLEQGKRVFADDTLNTLEFVNAEAQRLEKQYPQFEATAKAFYKWQDTFMREWFVRSGFSTLKAYNELRGRYPYYVPFMRNVGGRLGGNARRGFANQSTPLKRLKGSGREIINPVEATMLRVKEIMTKAERNRVMQEVSRVAMNEDGIGKIIERVPPKMVAKIVDISQQKNNLLELLGDKLDEEMLDDVWNDIEQTFDDQISNFVPGVNQGEDIVRVFVNGKQQYYQIHDENLLASLVGLGEETSNVVVRFFRGFTQFLKYLTTGGNFIWSITSNLARDFDSAFKKSQTTNNPIKFIKDYVSSAVNMIKNSEAYKLYKTAGGGYNNSLTANPRQWKSISREVVKQHESDFKRFVQTKLNLVEKIATFSDAIESAPRLAEFKRVLEQTGGDTKTALRAADEITVNFQRHGRYGKTVDAFVPYFNAGLQGLVSLYQSVKTRPFIIKSVTAAVFTTVLQFSWNKLIAPALFGADDDEYEKLSEYKKNNYYNLSLGNGYFISIPKSKDTGVLNSFFERVTEFFTSNDPDMKEMVLDFGGYLWSTFVPPGLSPSDLILFGTFYDIAKNEDFKGSPIVPASYEDLPPEYQYNEQTTWIAKSLGNLFGLSPMQIDYFISDNLGILGDINQSVGAPEKDWTFGVLNRVLVDNTYSTDVTNKFYDRYDTLKEYYNADPNLTENTVEYKLYSQARSVVSALNAYAKEDESMARTYRQMVNAYIEDFEKNGADPDQRVVDLYERTKNQDLFLERNFKRDYTVNGEKITMPVDTFLSYVEEYQDKAAEMYDKIFELHLSDEATVKLLNDAKGEIKDYVDAKYKTAVDEGEPFEEPENWMEEAFKQMYQDAKRKSAKTEQEQKDKVEYIDILKQLF